MTTVKDLATQLGCHEATITRHAKRLGFAKSGREYQFTRAQVWQLCAAVRPSKGNPDWIAQRKGL